MRPRKGSGFSARDLPGLLSPRLHSAGFDAVLRRGPAGGAEVRHALARGQLPLGGQSYRSGARDGDHPHGLQDPWNTRAAGALAGHSDPEGLVLLVGCSHPGIETILQASRPWGDRVDLIFGGLHLVTSPDSAITRLATALHDQWRVDQIAPGHCTGEPAFAALRRVFGRRTSMLDSVPATEVP